MKLDLIGPLQRVIDAFMVCSPALAIIIANSSWSI